MRASSAGESTASSASSVPSWIERGKDMERFKHDYWLLPKTFNPVRFDPRRWAKGKRYRYRIEIYTPEAYMGDIMGNLNGRRGKVQGMEQKGTMRVLKAQVPMSEMLDFEPTLTSITGGRGSFLMEFDHYEEAPSHIQQKIIADAVKEGRVRPEEED